MTDAAVFEAVTIQTYLAAVDSGILVNAPAELNLTSAAQVYLGHHNEHLAYFNQNFSEHNFPQVSADDHQADSRIAGVTTWQEAIQLTLTMEFEAAQFYYSRMNDQLTTQHVRKIFADVFPIEVGHVISYKLALGQSPYIDAGIFQNLTTGL